MGILQDNLKQICRLKGLNYVGSRGPKAADVVAVGEAPGANEDQAGLPFVGASGREQDKMLSEAGINPVEVSSRIT
jgi:DNA polymerase